MNLIIDTNVALDLWLFEDPRVDALRAALRSGLRTLATHRMRDELATVLARATAMPAFRARWPLVLDANAVLTPWEAHTLWADPSDAANAPLSTPRCRDASDQMFIDLGWTRTASASASAWLLTRDRDLLRLARRCARFNLTVTVPERLPLGSGPP